MEILLRNIVKSSLGLQINMGMSWKPLYFVQLFPNNADDDYYYCPFLKREVKPVIHTKQHQRAL